MPPVEAAIIGKSYDSLVVEFRLVRKRDRLARVARATGLTTLLLALARRRCLLCLNLHRVGDGAETPFDSGLFSSTPAQLDATLGWLKPRFDVLSLADAEAVIHGERALAAPSLLLTFDDGYRDNYTAAFPLLRSHNLPAAFFLPTAFVGTGEIPWWDRIAYLVKSSPRERLRLTFPVERAFDLPPAGRERVVAEILRLYKDPGMREPARFLEELEIACDTPHPSLPSPRLFMDWDEAREMHAAGMGIGSHTHTHPLLSKLSFDRQVAECRMSREILSAELRTPIDTFAYPDGKHGTFDDQARRAVAEAGYRTAFSFYSGVNRPGSIDPLDVRRAGIGNEPAHILRLRIASLAALGKELG